MAHEQPADGPLGTGMRTGDDPLVGTLVADKYRVQALVGRGRTGRVYRAEQAPLGRVVALKILTPGYLSGELQQVQKRFLREAAACARLTHPNTVATFDYGQLRLGGEDLFFRVTEYVEGRTLARALEEDGPFAPARALRVARQICRSLVEAHRLGVVHGDLKPGDVVLCAADGGETVQVLDFGLAHRQPDAENDLSALGAVLRAMLGGGGPPEVEAIVARCRTEDPAARYPDADALRQALAAACARFEPAGAAPDGDRSGVLAAAANDPAPPPAAGRHRWAWLAGALLVLALALAGLWAAAPAAPTGPDPVLAR